MGAHFVTYTISQRAENTADEDVPVEGVGGDDLGVGLPAAEDPERGDAVNATPMITRASIAPVTA